MVFTRTTRVLQTIYCNLLITKKRNFRVVVNGAAGGVGQACALLLKQNELVTSLVLHDLTKSARSLARDLSFLDTPGTTEGYTTMDDEKAFTGADLVVLTAGQKTVRLVGSGSRDHLMNVNGPIVMSVARTIAKYCPKALIVIISNPVNACVPIVSEVLKKNKVHDPRKIFGVTTLDLSRAQMLAAKINNVDPEDQFVPVVGGHDMATIIPLFSQAQPALHGVSDSHIIELTKRLQTLHLDVLRLKTSSATLSIAHAAMRFVNNLLRGLAGEKNIVDYSYVKSSVTPSPYFSSPLLLGQFGVKAFLPIGDVSPFEREQIENAVPILRESVKLGLAYVEKAWKE